MNEKLRPLLDESDLARVLRVSRSRLKKLDDSGILPKPIVIDGLKRWTPGSVEGFVHRLEHNCDAGNLVHGGAA